MKHIFCLLFIVVIFQSCNNSKKETPDGGPCSYDDKIYPARLVKLEMNTDSISYNAWLEIDNPSGNGKDTISYLRMTNNGIRKEQLEKDSISEGNIYKYVVSTIRTGACDPDIRTIRLERY
jgi:hypothetical protein